MTKIPAKIERKHIVRDGKSVVSLLVHPLQNLEIKSGQYIVISPTDMESVILLDPTPAPEPYYNK